MLIVDSLTNLIPQFYKQRIAQNKNWLALICGETGSGKSYSALRIAELCDRSFSINRVVFTAEQFMNVLSSRPKLKRGNIIIWDEAGVGLPAREWYSISNKAINYVLQTFRHENLGVIFTTPSFNFIDIQARKLFHTYIETQFINYKDEYVRVKWLNLQENPRLDKIYFHYPTVSYNGKRITVKGMNLHKPSQMLINAYEKRKRMFTAELKQDIKSIVEKKGPESTVDINDIVSTVLNSPEAYIKTYNKRKFIDVNKLINSFGIGISKAMRAKQRIEAELHDMLST